MITTKTRKVTEPSLSLIVALALAAALVPLYATYEQYRTVTIHAGEEDDCDLYHGAYALTEVTPDGHGDVWCTYR